ncbi:MAG TPA: DUF4340 domain-containing protein [Defluviitaleaceae bacterium]|jgi:hypothetical protein|nr:DUF4340 domain-containing protein [Candidatus Epulonipiscium sp.]HOQ17367.1 DUF4340 domain-containing protein [Defluviitaleaceae bacterium]HPT75690.1 DUF4340 domain-containing protein [Defluviitaleaceae bacterium]HQD51346.1 DUF4340 domain-containing protein [Defluviitaleaceae bacterium]
MKKIIPTLLAVIIFLAAYAYYCYYEKTYEVPEDETIYVWQLEKNKITHIDITHENQSIQLVRDGQSWNITQPIEFPADDFNVNTLLGRFNTLQATAFVEENSSHLSNYGVDSSKTSITFTDDEGNSNTLILGNEAPLSKGIYVYNKNNNSIYTISSRLLEDLSFDLDFFRDKILLSFKKEYIEKIKIENEGKTFEIQLKDDQWYSNDRTLDEASVRSLITVLNTRKISEFVKDNASEKDLEKYGLKNPRTSITIYLYDSDNSTLNLYLGNIEDTFTYASRDKKFIYKISSSSLLSNDLSVENFYIKNKE